MYQKLKRLLKTLIPLGFIYSSELHIRYFYYLFYQGKKYQCNVCLNKLRKFIDIGGSNLVCPACGSNSRNRRLWQILRDSYLTQNVKILHFSPARALYRKLKREQNITYVSSDFSGEFIADRQLDITHINENSNTFDLVICYHILEHIEDDQKAMSELYRILKPGGICLVQTPFKEGDIYEDPLLKTPQQRLKHYGQADHVRIYSAAGLKKRLCQAGFDVHLEDYNEAKDNSVGFKEKETVIFAKK